MIVAEKNGSLTINVNGGEVTMSTRNFGMVGKTYKTASEAFKDATWSTAIQRPEKNEYHHIWSILGALSALFLTLYVLNHFLPYQ
jgi:hypothetical protein